MYILRAALCCFYIVCIPLPVVVVSIAADVDFSSIIPHVTWLPTALYIAKSWRPPTIQLAERNSAVRPVDSATVKSDAGAYLCSVCMYTYIERAMALREPMGARVNAIVNAIVKPTHNRSA